MTVLINLEIKIKREYDKKLRPNNDNKSEIDDAYFDKFRNKKN